MWEGEQSFLLLVWWGMWEGSSLWDVAAQQHLVLGSNQEAMIGPGPTGREEVWEERDGEFLTPVTLLWENKNLCQNIRRGRVGLLIQCGGEHVQEFSGSRGHKPIVLASRLHKICAKYLPKK